MDTSLLLDQLLRTERHLRADQTLVQRQQAIIEQLERGGQDSTYARSLLYHLSEMQAMRRADLDRMRAALNLTAAPPEED
jgi:hypothetical protein